MTIDNFIMVYDTNSDPLVIEIPLFPDEVSESFSAEWQTASVVGRPVPVGVYTGSGYRQVTVNFDTHRELHPKVDEMLKNLKSTVYSTENEDGYVPKLALMCIGSFRAKGYITSVSYTWKKPIINNNYQVCSVGIQMNAIDMGTNSNY